MIALILSGGFFVWTYVRYEQRASSVVQKTIGSGVSTSLLETKTNGEGGVGVSVQPLDIQSDEWSFDVDLNTHTGSIDADFTKSATLMDERKNSFAPIRWSGAPLGGHHRQGTLLFKAISPRPSSITLIIRDVGGIAERAFTWQLSNQ